MKTNYLVKRIQFLYLLLLISSFSFAQEKSIFYNEIIHHKESGDFDKKNVNIFDNYRTSVNRGIQTTNFTIEKAVAQNIIKKNDKFITIQLPLKDSKQNLIYLKKRNVFDEDFSLVIQNNNLSKQKSINKEDYISYTGVIDGEESNSLVSIFFYKNVLSASILIADKAFSITQIENSDNYRLYEEVNDKTISPFSCGVKDDDNFGLENTVEESAVQGTTPKCVKLHFEITRNLNIELGGIEQSIVKFMTTFNFVQTGFANEGIVVKLSQLKIWDTDDPYYQTWVGNPGAPGAFQDLGLYSFATLGGTINGNIGILLSTFSGGVGGVALGNTCYAAHSAVTIHPSTFSTGGVKTIMHEIGHNLGSNHTHWCGWDGGAIDNCEATEGGCPPGPSPVNGGTIMSYCRSENVFNNGFGPQPNAVINNTVSNGTCFTACNSDTSCEDNIVNATSITNTSNTSFTVNWTSTYAVKVYFKEVGATDFDLLSTVQQPNNNYLINYTPSTNCLIQKFEIKLVSVCPNGDSKPTVIVYSPQGHSKPHVGLYQNYLCNIPNATIADLQADGQNLKWYITETGGTPMPTSQIVPLDVYNQYFVSQTINGCESERTSTFAYIRNVPTPYGESIQHFNCDTPTLFDLVLNTTDVLWWTAPTGGFSPNSEYILQDNTYYYAEAMSDDGLCISPERFPVLVTINPSGANPYTVPFIETFDNGLCALGYTNSIGTNFISEGNLIIRSINSSLIYTKGIILNANTAIKISLKGKRWFYNFTTPLTLKIGTDLNIANHTTLGYINPTSHLVFDEFEFDFTPNTSGIYYISFSQYPNVANYGFNIDDLKVENDPLSIAEFGGNLNVLIYPNPTHSIVNISSPNQIINQATIYDITGRLLKTEMINNNSAQLNFQDLPNAVYFMEIKTDKGSKISKIIKQ